MITSPLRVENSHPKSVEPQCSRNPANRGENGQLKKEADLFHFKFKGGDGDEPPASQREKGGSEGI